VDHGGPRKEWMEITNRELGKTYFDKGLRELSNPLATCCMFCGIFAATPLINDIHSNKAVIFYYFARKRGGTIQRNKF